MNLETAEKMSPARQCIGDGETCYSYGKCRDPRIGGRAESSELEALCGTCFESIARRVIDDLQSEANDALSQLRIQIKWIQTERQRA